MGTKGDRRRAVGEESSVRGRGVGNARTAVHSGLYIEGNETSRVGGNEGKERIPGQARMRALALCMYAVSSRVGRWVGVSSRYTERNDEPS